MQSPVKINFFTLHIVARKIENENQAVRHYQMEFIEALLSICEFKTMTRSEYVKDYEFPIIFQYND